LSKIASSSRHIDVNRFLLPVRTGNFWNKSENYCRDLAEQSICFILSFVNATFFPQYRMIYSVFVFYFCMSWLQSIKMLMNLFG
jgi:hypothetical protein